MSKTDKKRPPKRVLALAGIKRYRGILFPIAHVRPAGPATVFHLTDKRPAMRSGRRIDPSDGVAFTAEVELFGAWKSDPGCFPKLTLRGSQGDARVFAIQADSLRAFPRGFPAF